MADRGKGVRLVPSSGTALQQRHPQEAASSHENPRLTLSNYEIFHPREKKLPPEANVAAAANSKLLQFPLHVSFFCAKCRMDNIVSDCVAIDAVNRIMLCARCFTRIIRPRTYKPSRVVPFPSLLSWLNYQPAKVMTEVNEDVLSRPAEAVAPSGERIAGMLGGSGGASGTDKAIRSLPASAAKVVSVAGGPHNRRPGDVAHDSGSNVASSNRNATHPCERVWNHCMHGETCLFRNAPRDLCVGYLMGLCDGAASHCKLLHQHVFDLPNTLEPVPRPRKKNDLNSGSNSQLAKWIEKRMNSSNRAEWQLWHNGSYEGLLDEFLPCIKEEPSSSSKEKAGNSSSNKSNSSPSPTARGNATQQESRQPGATTRVKRERDSEGDEVEAPAKRPALGKANSLLPTPQSTGKLDVNEAEASANITVAAEEEVETAFGQHKEDESSAFAAEAADDMGDDAFVEADAQDDDEDNMEDDQDHQDSNAIEADLRQEQEEEEKIEAQDSAAASPPPSAAPETTSTSSETAKPKPSGTVKFSLAAITSALSNLK